MSREADTTAPAPPSDAAPEVAAVDGRTARRDRNQLSVLDAVLALFREDNLQPKPEEVAARSGVSLRSVYRYYSEPTQLLEAAMARHLELVEPFWQMPGIGHGGLEDRVDRFIAARSELYERLAPTARAARLASVNNPLIRAQFERGRLRLRTQVVEQFAPELSSLTGDEREATTNALDALFQLDGFEYYRVHRGLTPVEAARLLRIAVLKLLTTS